MSKKPKILVLDIETSPVLAHVWALFDQNIALNQIERDWFVLSWAAKWLGEPESKVMYADQSKAKNIENDKNIIKQIWALLNDCDIVVTQNGKRFDIKKLNARFIHHGLNRPSSFKHIDTLVIAKKHFAFTSNKLEYMTDKLCTKYKKLTTRKYSGFSLWKECLIGNQEAWKEMAHYNKYDILSLEELFGKLRAWDNSINFNLYDDEVSNKCNCGSDRVRLNGFSYTSVGKYQRYKCSDCGAEVRSRKNLFTKTKKESLKVKS